MKTKTVMIGILALVIGVFSNTQSVFAQRVDDDSEIEMKEKHAKGDFSAGRSPDGFGVFKNHETDWCFKRTLQYAYVGAAQVGECLYAAKMINQRGEEYWSDEWYKLAQRLEKQADESLVKGNKISARDAYLRACNYYRTAEYGASPNDTMFKTAWEKSRACFHKACPLFTPAIQIIEVPFEDQMLPGYFWTPDNTEVKRPTLFSVGGNDSSGEEVFFFDGKAAIERGYNFFTFEFPGHRGTVHLYPDCVKRADMEKAFKAAFDVLETLQGVDERIALTGISFGGYVSSRVAIHEPRVAAVIPNSPLIDIKRTQEEMLTLLDSKFPEKMIARMLDKTMNKSLLTKSMLEYSMWNNGLHDYSGIGIINSVKEYDYEPWNISQEIEKITCPVLILVSEDEGKVLLEQAYEFYEGVSSEVKHMHIFSLENDGSNDHCQLDNRSRSNEVKFDWLNEVFNYYHSKTTL
jgi:esterase/lipase